MERNNANVMDLNSSWEFGHILDLDLLPCVANVADMMATVHAFTWLQTVLMVAVLAIIYYYLFLPMNYVRVSIGASIQIIRFACE
jgi:hypothetical protein